MTDLTPGTTVHMRNGPECTVRAVSDTHVWIMYLGDLVEVSREQIEWNGDKWEWSGEYES